MLDTLLLRPSLHCNTPLHFTKAIVSTLSLTSALDCVGGQSHDPAALTLEKPGTHCTGGWLGPRAGLERCGQIRPHRDSISLPSSL
jgi:hypothetical protein